MREHRTAVEPAPNAKPRYIQLPSQHEVTARDIELFERQLRAFVPPDAFDAHAHVYPLATLGIDFPEALRPIPGAVVGIADYRRSTTAWMGDRCPQRGLFFGLPSSRRVNTADANAHVAREVAAHPGSYGLLLVRPSDDPAAIEAQFRSASGVAGFKVYHTFASRSDTANAEIEEYLPPWVWELAHAHGKVIMLHLVKPRALADEGNQQTLRESLGRWTNARLVLAHAARGFCAQHTIEGIGSLAGFDNVFFDTSAICEADALLAVLRHFGPRRLLFGTDYPVSAMRGRCVSVGDGFFWLTEDVARWSASPFGQPTLVGIESMLALKRAIVLAGVGDTAIEQIFQESAKTLMAP